MIFLVIFYNPVNLIDQTDCRDIVNCMNTLFDLFKKSFLELKPF